MHQRIGYLIINAVYPAFNAHVVLWGTIAAMLLASYGVNRAIERRYAKRFGYALDSALLRVQSHLAHIRFALSFMSRR